MSFYKLIGGDGKEYGPMDQSGVRAMYRDGRAMKDTLVFVSFRSQWSRLGDVFDVGKWDLSEDSEAKRSQAVAMVPAESLDGIATPTATLAFAWDAVGKEFATSKERACSRCGE